MRAVVNGFVLIHVAMYMWFAVLFYPAFIGSRARVLDVDKSFDRARCLPYVLYSLQVSFNRYR